MSQDKSTYILTELKNGLRTIRFNRPSKKNALCIPMYIQLTQIFEKDAMDNNIKGTIITGIGDFYTSGTDISSGEDAGEKAPKIVEAFIGALINYPKILIAVVNGPAIGIGMTTLALCDIVYCSEKATFSTPFTKLALCPEGCSSYLFSRILGKSKANEVLLLGYTLTAQEAYQFGFVSKVFPHDKLSKLIEDLHKINELPVQAVLRAKRMVNYNLRNILHATNKMECENLGECFNSDEFWEAISNFFQKKSKL